ncbi:MAG TPA: CHAT domain-containing protein [Solirubrobacteraceae bacterium]|jgi:hypothetical protein
MKLVADARADAALARLVESPPRPQFGPDRLTLAEDQELVAGLGSELGEALLGDPALEPLRKRLAERPPARIRLLSDEPRLLDIPWELLTLGRDPQTQPLAEQCEIVRVPYVEANANSSPMSLAARHGPELRIAIVSPRPFGAGDVPLQPAVGPILGTTLAFPAKIQLSIIRPPTLSAVEREIARNGPFDIVHFDGHGREAATGGTELVFENERGHVEAVDADTFATVVADADPRLILLNACRSAAASSGPTPAPSFAATLCRRLPRAHVVAMRYAVSTGFVEALVSHFYPLLVAGASLGEAIKATNARLSRAWRRSAPPVAPLFVNLTVWSASTAEESDIRAGGLPEVRPIDWREAAPALFWAEEIESVHSALDTDRQILLANTIGSATSEIVHLFSEYATATGAYDRTVAGLGEDALTAPDGTLHVVVAEPEGNRQATSDACAKLLDGKPRSAGIIVVTDGRPLPDLLHVGDYMVPIELIRARLRSTLKGRDPLARDADAGRAFELVRICQDDFATLAALSKTEDFQQAVELLEHLRWGANLDGLELAEPLRAAFATLSHEQAKLVSLLGLSGGGLVYRELLSLVTTGGVEDTSFIDALGRQVEAAEWDEAFQAAASAGLFRLLERLASSPTALVTPLQALCLRERLTEWVGKDGLSQLQRAFAECAIAFSTGFNDAFLHGDSGIYENFLVSSEGLMARTLELGLREQDDELAARGLHQLLSRPAGGSQGSHAHLRGCEALASMYPLDRLPDFRAALLAWRARDTIDREHWSEGLAQAEQALSVQGASWRWPAKTHILIMRSRALWRTARTAEAEGALADAARSAGPAQRPAVASACADFAQYLHLDANQTELLRRRVGAPREEQSASRDAIAAEAAGRYGDAYALWIANLRECETQGATSRALALEELGRFCAMYGTHEDAKYWLRRRLERGAELGLDPERPLRYLGLSAERNGLFDEATSWLNDALAAARASGDEHAQAECLYELALVAMQSDDAPPRAGQQELLDALAIFERIGPPAHVGDCWLLLAQLEARAKDMTAARAAAERMTAVYRACNADAERLANAEQVIGVLGDR